jgi:hypothetical protein
MLEIVLEIIFRKASFLLQQIFTHFKMMNTGSKWKSWNFSKSQNRKISEERVRGDARENGLFATNL